MELIKNLAITNIKNIKELRHTTEMLGDDSFNEILDNAILNGIDFPLILFYNSDFEEKGEYLISQEAVVNFLDTVNPKMIKKVLTYEVFVNKYEINKIDFKDGEWKW